MFLHVHVLGKSVPIFLVLVNVGPHELRARCGLGFFWDETERQKQRATKGGVQIKTKYGP